MNVFQFDPELGTGYKTYNIIYDKYEDFMPINAAFLFDPKPIKSWWQPLEIQWLGNESDYDDPFPKMSGTIDGDISYCWGLSGILFSQHAVTVFEPYLQNTVEFLPLKLQPNKTFFALKILKNFNIEDILDMDKSIIKWGHRTRRQKKLGIPKWIDFSELFLPHFHEEMLNDILIFTIEPSCLGNIYITNKFVDIMNKNNFTGATFKQIYPPPAPKPNNLCDVQLKIVRL